MFEGWTSPFAQANRQTEDRNAAWNAIRNDPGSAALIAGLSLLTNNDGSRSFGQLVGRAGFDTLTGLGSMEAQRQAQERQEARDAERSQYRDMQMQEMQAGLDEQNRRRDLQQRFAAGDETALKELDPLAWWKNEQKKQQAEQSLRNAMTLAGYRAKLDAGNAPHLRYVNGLGMVDKRTGLVTPLMNQKGEVVLSPKQRRQREEGTKGPQG